MWNDSSTDLCAHQHDDGTFCPRTAHPDFIHCGRHGGADPVQPRTISHQYDRYTR